MNDLPALVGNLEWLNCHFCARRPEHLEPRWHGPHIGAHCPRCGGRLGANDKWLQKSRHGLTECRPPMTDDPRQGGLFDGAGSG